MLLRPGFVLIVTLFTLLNVQTLEGKRGRYRYNHPPSIENVDTVPAADVSEPGDVRESKTLKLPEDTKTDTTEDITKVKENEEKENKGTEKIIIDVVTPAPEAQKKSIQRKPFVSRTNNRRNLQIPVNVVYEAEPNKVQSSQQENEESSKKLVPRRNQIRRRLQKPTAVEESQKEEQKPQEEKNQIDQQRSNDDTSNLNQEKSTQSTSTAAPSTPPPKTETTQSATTKDQPPVTTERSRKRTRTRPPIVPIVTEENFVYSHSGNFHYRFEGGDGTKVYEEGTLKSIKDDAGEAVQGGFSYTDNEGNDYSISYTADENGYRPYGAHLPTPPPIPPAIARALVYLATKSTPQPATESIKNVD